MPLSTPAADFPVGRRVRIVRGESIASRLHEGRLGIVAERSPNLEEVESAEHRATFPVSVRFLYQTHGFVWRTEELELLPEDDDER